MLIEDLAQVLEAAGITPVYRYRLADPNPALGIPATGVALMDYAGLPPVWVQPRTAFDPVRPAYEQPRVQVRARGEAEDDESALALAWQAYQALAAVKNAALASGTHYQSVSPLQTPTLLERDQNLRPIFVFNCEVFKAFG